MFDITVTCGKCQKRSVFQVENDAITYAPGRFFEADLDDAIPPNAREMFSEALTCLYGASHRGVVAFCRSAVEEALDAKGVPGSNLDAKIKKAGDYLTDEEKALANAARIFGRKTLHRMAKVSKAQAMGALTNTADLLNSVSAKEPFPAWKSKTGSSE